MSVLEEVCGQADVWATSRKTLKVEQARARRLEQYVYDLASPEIDPLGAVTLVTALSMVQQMMADGWTPPKDLL